MYKELQVPLRIKEKIPDNILLWVLMYDVLEAAGPKVD